jgi:hypothetical protein
MNVESLSFGSINIDGTVYEKDIIIDRGKIFKRNKKASKEFRDEYGHTPLSAAENIPWDCRTLIIGNGHSGNLPVMEEVKKKADKLKIRLLIMNTPEAVKHLNDRYTNFILHLTC